MYIGNLLYRKLQIILPHVLSPPFTPRVHFLFSTAFRRWTSNLENFSILSLDKSYPFGLYEG